MILFREPFKKYLWWLLLLHVLAAAYALFCVVYVGFISVHDYYVALQPLPEPSIPKRPSPESIGPGDFHPLAIHDFGRVPLMDGTYLVFKNQHKNGHGWSVGAGELKRERVSDFQWDVFVSCDLRDPDEKERYAALVLAHYRYIPTGDRAEEAWWQIVDMKLVRIADPEKKAKP